MKIDRRPVLVFVYNSFKDPLFYNLLLVNLKNLNQNNTYDFYLITHEQVQYKLTNQELEVTKKDLKKFHIHWFPLKWHPGKYLLIKAFDFLKGFLLVLFLKFKFKIKVILTFANISGAFGFIYSRMLKMDFIIFSYEPHCEFMADLGMWSKESIKYKVAKKIDYLIGTKGEYIITGTRHMVERLRQWGRTKNTYLLPTPVDEDDFIFTKSGRDAVRKKYGAEDKKVFLYMGKFGDLYYKKEIPEFCKTLLKHNKNYFFLIVTSNNHEEINALFQEQGINKECYIITGNLSYPEVKDYISASDIGISAVPPSPSQLFRSPTKTGEFLACGLPYITVKGVSEDDEYALKYHVGVVVDSFMESDLTNKIKDIDAILLESKESLQTRCREIGILYRGKGKSKIIFTEILEKIFHY
jgi:hypothetical protein